MANKVLAYWSALDDLTKVLLAAMFFVTLGVSGERLMGQQRLLPGRVSTLEEWRSRHEVEYQQKERDIQQLRQGMEYLICTKRKEREGAKGEQSCYEQHILGSQL